MPTVSSCTRRLLIGWMLATIAGCASLQPPDQWLAYRNALADAAVAEPEDALPLQPIPQEAAVSVVSWMAAGAVPCHTAECLFETGEKRIWVVLDSEIRPKCAKWSLHGDALRERLEQLLGLPPGTPPERRKTQMVTMRVPPGSLQRPCLGEESDASGVPRCTLRPSPEGDVNLRSFVLEQMANSWVIEKGAPGYPFTRLGYTFDWHASGERTKRYGASEFVLRPGTEVKVLSTSSTDDYCS